MSYADRGAVGTCVRDEVGPDPLTIILQNITKICLWAEFSVQVARRKCHKEVAAGEGKLRIILLSEEVRALSKFGTVIC